MGMHPKATLDMRRTLAMILAGGVGSRLSVLVQHRAKPAVPFGGIYRIIDFSFSNAMNSGIERLGVLTQYLPYSLTEHIAHGDSWGLLGRTREAKILPPHTGNRGSDWYRGTADAIYRNLSYIRRHNPELVLILSGDHVYYMDYRELIQHHLQTGAAATIAVREVPLEEVSSFGTLVVEGDRVVAFEEKPQRPRSNLISMGIYLFHTEALLRSVIDTCHFHGENDFGRHVFPRMLGREKLSVFRFHGYWQDVGTIPAYFEANMDLLRHGSGLDLPAWGIRTNMSEDGIGDLPPAYVAEGAAVRNSVLSRGCRILGTVASSVLSPGVIVEEGATISDSILLHDTHVERGATLERVIADKECRIGAGAHLGADLPPGKLPDRPAEILPETLPDTSAAITVLGKRVEVGPGCAVGRGCCVHPHASLTHLAVTRLANGETVEWEETEI